MHQGRVKLVEQILCLICKILNQSLDFSSVYHFSVFDFLLMSSVN